MLIGTQFVIPRTLLKFQNAIFHILPDSMLQQMGFGKKDFIKLSKSMVDLDFHHDLNKLTCPVLVICGENDKANKKVSIDLRKLLPNAEIQIIENAGHEVNLDSPEKLGKILNTFYMKNC